MNGGEPKLNDCGCCEGVEKLTPADLFNAPGLTALAYRVGTHSAFKQSMQVDLSDAAELNGLKTRRDDDPTICLLDAWATTLDVLTFYQERVANEGYLRTATERRSLLELARAIGYELRPGVAASTYIAFNLEAATGAPPQVSLPIGIKAQSVPEQGQQAQIFETVEEIVARPDWNKLQPRLAQRQEFQIDSGDLFYKHSTTKVSSLYLAGTSTGVAPGDLVLITSGEGAATRAVTRRVLSVTIDVDTKRTKVEIEPKNRDLAEPPSDKNFDSIQFDPHAPPLPFNEKNIRDYVLRKRLRERDLATFLELNNWLPTDLAKLVAKIAKRPLSHQTVFVFRERAGFFGNNAPAYGSLRDKNDQPLFADDWDSHGWRIWDAYPRASGYLTYKRRTVLWSSHESSDAFLERSISGIVPGGWAVFSVANLQHVYQISDVHELSLSAFAMSGKATGLTLRNLDGSPAEKPDEFLVRKTTAYVKNDVLDLASVPIEDKIASGSTSLMLETMVLGLRPKQLIVLTGERDDARGVMQSELLELQDVIHHRGRTVLLFSALGTPNGLFYSYVRGTVTLNANVARATHGETKHEVLGSGDASVAWQKFNLKQAPLTYVAAPTPTGSASTLQLRVNDILWDQSRSFYELSPKDRKYVIRLNDDGTSTVEAGDGITGARLSTGVENVTAQYRVGSGLGGMVKAGQISLLLSRPAGLKEVTNPLPASGGADAENRDQARDNAPVTVLTLERIVSLQDYENFVRAYPGIGKAQAVLLWDGENKVVNITVAGADGNPIDASSGFYRNLALSIQAASDPGHCVRINSFEPLAFNLQAGLIITQGYLATKVIADVSSAVRAAFSFEHRDFGQAVTRSEVEAVMQAVPGVDAVILGKFYFSSKTPTRESRLGARIARWSKAHKVILAAELLLVNPREIQLTETQP